MPKRANNEGSIRQRPDGRWEARYTLGRDPGTGKQVQKSIYGGTQKEVRQRLQRIATDIEAGVFVQPSRMTIEQWIDVWLAEYTGHLKESTISLYKRHAKKIIAPKLGAVKLSALTKPAAQAFINGLQKGGAPLGPKSIKNVHGVLHKALQQAVELDYIRVNPATACKLPRVERFEMKPLDNDDMSRFLSSIKGHEYERAFIVDLFTGLRQGELLGLTWDCVDFKAGTIRIYRQLQLIEGQYKFTGLKNDKPRRLAPGSFVMRTLQEQRRAQAEMRLAAGRTWQDEDFVFTNALGAHLPRQTVYRAFKRVVAGMGLSSMRFHDLRHSYAVMALRSGMDVKSVQASLGHHTAAFTLDQYGHVTESMEKENAARIDAFIQGLKTSE